MPTSARKRRNVDMGRLREALRGPEADTRVWLATALVDDDPDAIMWDDRLGWVVDVTFYGGPLDQEGPVPCRVGMVFAENGATKSDPPGRGCEVLVAITDGDPNSNPVIVARMHNAGGCEVPSSVNGFPVTEEKMLADHVVVSPKGADEEYAGDRKVAAENQELLAQALAAVRADSIHLGGTAATPASGAIAPAQSFIRGEDYTDAADTLVGALQTWTQAVAGALQSAGFAITVAQTDLETAIGVYRLAVPGSLSDKIKGE